MRQACLALQAALPVLGRISPQALRSLLRPLFVAGWSPADVVHAIGHRPDGTTWHHAHDVAHVPGWLRHRLTSWHTTDGVPRLSHTRQLAVAAAEDAAARRAAAERAAVERAAAVPAAAVPALVEQLAAIRARSAAIREARRRQATTP